MTINIKGKMFKAQEGWSHSQDSTPTINPLPNEAQGAFRLAEGQKFKKLIPPTIPHFWRSPWEGWEQIWCHRRTCNCPCWHKWPPCKPETPARENSIWFALKFLQNQSLIIYKKSAVNRKQDKKENQSPVLYHKILSSPLQYLHKRLRWGG